MPSDCSNFEDEETAALMYAKLLRYTGYTRRAALTKGKTPGFGESPSDQPISGPVIFSKRQALSRAVVVNSNMSRGKYLAREGPGSRLMAKLKGKLGCTLNLTIRYCTPSAQPDIKVKVKVIEKQAKTAFLHGPTV